MLNGPRKQGKQKAAASSRRSSGGWIPGVSSWAEFLKPLKRVSPAGARESRSPRKSAEIVVFSYEITRDPIEENPADYRISAHDLQRIQTISQQIHDAPLEQLVERLEAMIAEFPQVPKVWNHLAIAYQAAGRVHDYERVMEETYRRFPDYLFGLVNYGMLRLHQGHPEEIPLILRGTFALHELQGGRMTYHLSEARSFCGLLVSYFLAINELKTAAGYLDILEKLDPEHPLTQMVRSQMLLSLSEVVLGGGEH